jgi:hypothetical protein
MAILMKSPVRSGYIISLSYIDLESNKKNLDSIHEVHNRSTNLYLSKFPCVIKFRKKIET